MKVPSLVSFLEVLLLVAGHALGKDQDCLVGIHTIQCPINESLLVYLRPNTDIKIIMPFEDKDYKYRDSILLYNTRAQHYKMRKNGDGNLTNITLPSVLPEGWNSLKLIVEGNRVELVRLFDGEGQEILLSCSLDYSVSEVEVEGDVARCSGESPEWKLKKDEEVVVLLHPPTMKYSCQTLEVLGRDIEAVMTLANSQNQTIVTTNTTFEITTWRHNNYGYIKAIKAGEDEEVKTTLEVNLPLFEKVKSIRGNVFLRLNLTHCEQPSQTPSSKTPETHWRWHTFMYLVVGGVPFIVGVVLGMVAVIFKLLRYPNAPSIDTHRTGPSGDDCERQELSQQHVTKETMSKDDKKSMIVIDQQPDNSESWDINRRNSTIYHQISAQNDEGKPLNLRK